MATHFSHDQGFSDFPHNHGTYDFTHTWFDAHVLEPSGLYRVPRLQLHRNVHARFEPTKHVTAFDFRDEPDENSDQGSSEAWLSAIKSGDTVQLVPRAQWQAWVNWVIEGRIEVWVETVAAMTSDRPDPDERLYRPLNRDEREIRVVAIEPGKDDTLTHLSLRYTSLSRPERLHFNALSYCWGETTNTTLVPLTSHVDDERVSSHIAVNDNLLAALKRLRREDAACLVWIDLICVKQSDVAERSQQVAMMSDIFSYADHVFVWLGITRNAAMRDLAAFKDITSKYQDNLNNNKDVDKFVEGMTRPIATHRIVSDGIAWYHFDNTRIFSLPWFHRVWVLQEVWSTKYGATIKNISKRVSVLCGPEELPWAAFIQANHCINTYYGRTDTAANMMPGIWKTLFHAPRHTSPFHVTPKQQLNILDVAIDGLDMRATDARDKLFALLVFGNETHNLSYLPPLVRPDYSKPVVKVYADFTRWWIDRTRSLRILSTAQIQAGRTWLDMSNSSHGAHDRPGLSERPSWSFWFEGRSSWKQSLLGLDERASYNASAGRDLDASLLEEHDSGADSHKLALRGLRLGRISSRSYYPLLRDPVVSPEMRRAYLHITNVETSWSSSQSEPDASHNGIIDHYRAHYNGPSIGSERITDYLPCHGKCMFTTEDGLTGLCPAGAEIGDIVVVLYGAFVPSLLRPKLSSGEHCFVGECYVDGFMQGECFTRNIGAGRAAESEIFLLV
ncbi:hypothetical protein KVR01_008123 [Diaporthe batatas]|uniref:uncharacterized protein n=1 Tax=Diaporthe batatas TaxID=748121 RepID=UPI001D040B6F|nr:uncharacterized protein KVR01_008123 [Diaporthe batatas]KAG8162358.1 hypothetical protein KVR01_008123 [Diaporthe batatas]